MELKEAQPSDETAPENTQPRRRRSAADEHIVKTGAKFFLQPSQQGPFRKVEPLNHDQSHTSTVTSEDTDDVSEEVSDGRTSGTSIEGRYHLIKSLADLGSAKRPTFFKKLDGAVARKIGGVLDCYPELVAITHNEGVISGSLKTFVEANLHSLDWPPPHAYDSTTKLSEYDKLIGDTALEIFREAQDCEKNSLGVPSWRSNVNNTLLKLIERNPKYQNAVKHCDITGAKITPKSLLPGHLGGEAMLCKGVSYSIYLQTDRETIRAVRSFILAGDRESRSVNQTNCNLPVREHPVAINLVTKDSFSGGEMADVQLAMWTICGLTRLREMLIDGGKSDEPIPALPMLECHGHDYHLLIFEEQAKCNVMYGRFRLGSTRNLFGTFQVIKALDLLVNWANTEYRKWFFSTVVPLPKATVHE